MRNLLRWYLLFGLISAIIGLSHPVRRWITAFLIDTAYVPALKLTATVREIHSLRAEADSLMMENIRLRATIYAIQRQEAVRKWLDSPVFVDTSYVTATAIAYIPITVPQNIVIDKGAFHGIRKNAFVLSSKGLAGRVIEVRPYASTFMSIYNSGFKVSVMDTRSGVLGVVDGGRMKLDYVPHGSDVIVGDTVVTSGLGRLYPSGLPVAIISEIDTSKTAEMFMEIKVEPLFKPARTAAFWVGRR